MGKRRERHSSRLDQSGNLWELTAPREPTYRAGTVTDGVLLAPGMYMPEGILPQGEELVTGHRQLDAYPVYATEEQVLADHNALFLDLTPVDIAAMPRLAKYEISTRTKWGRQERNQNIEEDPKY